MLPLEADEKYMLTKSKSLMNQLTKIGRLLYGIGIAALGIHQLVIKDFRSEILSPFPAWAHKYTVFPILTGIALIFAGTITSGLFKIKFVSTKNIFLYLGFCFLVLVVTSHLPYILILSPDKASSLEVWFGAAEALAYSGGAFVMAGSFPGNSLNGDRKNFCTLSLEKFIPCGRIFYSVLMILFGWSHFVFTDFVSTMVPKWLPAPMFWTYFFGVALISSGIAIIFKMSIRPIAFLLAIMLFLFFIFFHVPDAIANPSTGGGNEIVRAIIALLFCSIALVISSTNDPQKQN
ncbi:MAG: DoxX family membrane protein [Saprospiraceae bacterium]